MVDVNNIPQELKDISQWVVWKNKIPHKTDGSLASVDNPTTWTSFENAYGTYDLGLHDFEGVGFVVSNRDRFCIIDLDACVDPETNEMAPWAEDVVKLLDSYTEVSPSGTGLRIVCLGTIPTQRRRHGITFRGMLEAAPNCGDRVAEISGWNSNKYFTMTGNTLVGHHEVKEAQEGLNALVEEYRGEQPQRNRQQQHEPRDLNDARRDALIQMNAHRAGHAEQDGSGRLMIVVRIAYERGLPKDIALDVVMEYLEDHPLPIDHDREYIRTRIEDVWQRQEDDGRVQPDPAEKVRSTTVNPEDVAIEFLQACEVDDVPTIYYHQQTYWFWHPTFGCFRPMDDGAFQSYLVSHHLQYRYFSLSNNFVRNVVNRVTDLCRLDENKKSPTWVGHGDAPYSVRDIIPCKNGLVHLPTRQVFESTPRLFSTNCLPVRYDANAPEPVEWHKFLDSLWPGDQEVIEALQDWMGYLVMQDMHLQKMVALIGPPRSGKGTIARVLEALMGREQTAGIDVVELYSRFGLSTLVGKSLAIVADARISRKADRQKIAKTILNITGQDPVTVDIKGKTPINTDLNTRLMFMSNEMPSLFDGSGALAKRIIFLRMTRSFYGQEDTQLFDKLKLELPGILLWALEGADRVRKRGTLLQPKAGSELTETFHESSDPIGEFLGDCCLKGGYETPGKQIYEAYKYWCADNGHKPRAHSAFSAELNLNHNIERRRVGRSKVVHYQGVKLLPPPEEIDRIFEEIMS